MQLAEKLPWKKIWRSVSTFFTTHRDELTWLKLRHRALMVANKGQGDRRCLLCNEEESMLHLGRCPVIRRDFWTYFVDLIGEMGLEKPQDLDKFLMTGAMD